MSENTVSLSNLENKRFIRLNEARNNVPSERGSYDFLSENPNILPVNDENRFSNKEQDNARRFMLEGLQRQKYLSEVISDKDSRKITKAKEIINFHDETKWKLLKISSWVLDVTDLIEGIGMIISAPLNVYIFVRYFKLKRLTGKWFDFYDYFCFLIEFVPFGDYFPGTSETIRIFTKQADSAKKDALNTIEDIEKKFPGVTNDIK